MDNDNMLAASLLAEAKEAWTLLSNFRAARERNKNYTFGRQWCDPVDPAFPHLSEEQYLRREGQTPLKNNLLRRIVRNVLGVFRSRLAEKMDSWQEDMRSLASANDLYELYSRSMEEFLISGLAVHRKWVGRRNGRRGVWTDAVSPDTFFFTPGAKDYMGNDVSVVGQIHDVSYDDFCEAFASSPQAYDAARRFFIAHGCRKLRVTEIWRREKRPRRLVHDPSSCSLTLLEEADWLRRPSLHSLPSRWGLQEVWRYYFVADDGTILSSGDSPYPHGSHPFIFRPYPFLDGEIHSFIEDAIDQQRYTNRLITMYDWMMRTSAKGVLLLPQGAVDEENIGEVVEEWGRFNGVIVYRHEQGTPEPHQISNTNPNMAVTDLLNIQLKMLEDVSGVNGTLQGNLASPTVSGALYSRQTENALTSLRDVLDAFSFFITECMEKDRSLLGALQN